MRILLIEDDRALCTALLPALQAAGYTVDTCHDGADGKALLCGGAYDVCVLDRMLPGLDGWQVLGAAAGVGGLRSSHGGIPVPGSHNCHHRKCCRRHTR